MKPHYVKLGSERYVKGEIKSFDEKNMMFRRVMWDMPRIAKDLYFTPKMPKKKPGYTQVDSAFRNASWDLERDFGMGNRGGGQLLLDWYRQPKGEFAPPPSLPKVNMHPSAMSKRVKKISKFFGASLVGISRLDRRWVYSHSYHPTVRNPFSGEEINEEDIQAGVSKEIEIPQRFRYAIVFAIEMDYELVKYTPSYTSGAGAGLCYSKMPFIGAMIAQFIRGLGYEAIPMGNDTACSIPLAIDAGLGELGRNGLLITPQFGPRVRLGKVFTNMELTPDAPIEFGVWDFCRICKKCAQKCPSNSISEAEPTLEVHNISNRKGVFRWPVNGESCISFWAKNNSSSCLNCILVCPFNKPQGIVHEAVRWGVNNLRSLNRLFLWGDELFGYVPPKKSRYILEILDCISSDPLE